MKKFLFLTLFVAMACTACDDTNETPTPQEALLTLTSASEITLDANGDSAEITFTLENAPADARVVPTCSADWIKDLATGKDKITFIVMKNDTGKLRETKIKASYEDQSFEVTVKQPNAEVPPIEEWIANVELTANYLEGTYYGNYESDAYNYFIILSDKGVDENGQPKAGGNYYAVNAYSATPVGTSETLLPTGTYRFDNTSSYAADTFSYESSYFLPIGEDGSAMGLNGIIAGEMVVSEEQITLLIMLDNGEIHQVTYNGTREISKLPEPEETYSNLTDNYDLGENKNGMLYAETYGDDYGLGLNNWVIMAISDATTMSGDLIMLEILVDPSADDITGTYVVYSEESDQLEGTFLPGEVEIEDNYLIPIFSWFVSISNMSMDGKRLAPLMGGEVVIEKDEEGYYTLTINCIDDKGYQITGSISGVGEIYNESEFTGSIQSRRTPLSLPLHKTSL